LNANNISVNASPKWFARGPQPIELRNLDKGRATLAEAQITAVEVKGGTDENVAANEADSLESGTQQLLAPA
jgi:hypothetical protein